MVQDNLHQQNEQRMDKDMESGIASGPQISAGFGASHFVVGLLRLESRVDPPALGNRDSDFRAVCGVTNVSYWGCIGSYIGIMAKKMETTTSSLGFRVWGLGFLRNKAWEIRRPDVRRFQAPQPHQPPV